MKASPTVYRKEDIRDRYSISFATVNNWIKSGLIPAPENGIYSADVFEKIIKTLDSNSDKLKSRANRSRSKTSEIVFLGIKTDWRKNQLVNVVKKYKTSNLSICEAVCQLGVQILKSNNLYEKKSSIAKELEKRITNENIFKKEIIQNANDDLLGAFYQSIQSVANKSRAGSYYTPCELLKEIQIPETAKVLDPCCGSGGILINIISKNHNPENIYAFDIDDIALLICKINLILFFENCSISPHVEKRDLIFNENQNLFYKGKKVIFDYIVSNPPWGNKLSLQQKKILLEKYPELSTTEVFSISLYNSVKNLSPQSTLIFFLPESILNVAAHKKIRKFILNLNRNIKITPLGNCFKGVQSECVKLELGNEKSGESKIIVVKNEIVEIKKNEITSPNYFIPYEASNFDYMILKKIYNTKHTTLSLKTKFALGIVTGNNKNYIHQQKKIDDEPIFRGKDILPYKLQEPKFFINFTPEIFQQVAPINLYRSKKIVYRFISEKLICALDEKNQLVLNSANIFISEDYPMEIIVCLFNSCLYSFIFQKKFKSKKVLKQHLKDLPLPILTDDLEKEFLNLYVEIANGEYRQEKIDKLICQYFGITDEEYEFIISNKKGDRKISIT